MNTKVNLPLCIDPPYYSFLWAWYCLTNNVQGDCLSANRTAGMYGVVVKLVWNYEGLVFGRCLKLIISTKSKYPRVSLINISGS